jgi:hypothetical protein
MPQALGADRVGVAPLEVGLGAAAPALAGDLSLAVRGPRLVKIGNGLERPALGAAVGLRRKHLHSQCQIATHSFRYL